MQKVNNFFQNPPLKNFHSSYNTNRTVNAALRGILDEK